MIVLELATGGELFDFMMYTGSFPESECLGVDGPVRAPLLVCSLGCCAGGAWRVHLPPQRSAVPTSSSSSLA